MRKLLLSTYLGVLLLAVYATYVGLSYPCDPLQFEEWDEVMGTVVQAQSEQNKAWFTLISPDACPQACRLYEERLQDLKSGEESSIEASPNPFCFKWDTVEMNRNDESYGFESFKAQKERNTVAREHHSSMFKNMGASVIMYLYLIRLCWFKASKSFAANSFVIYVLFQSALYGYHAAEFLTCTHQVAVHHPRSGKFLRFDNTSYCDETLEVPTGLTLDDAETLEAVTLFNSVTLPSSPFAWTVYQYNWILVAALSLLVVVPLFLRYMELGALGEYLESQKDEDEAVEETAERCSCLECPKAEEVNVN